MRLSAKTEYAAIAVLELARNWGAEEPVRIRSIRSSSTQPPDTDPTTSPSSRRASSAPGGRGAEPHVSTTVTSQTARPERCQSRAC